MSGRREPRHLAAEGRAGGLRKPLHKSRLRRIWEHFGQDLSEQEQQEDLVACVEKLARAKAESALISLGAEIHDPLFRSMIELHALGVGLAVQAEFEAARERRRRRGNPGSDTFVRWVVWAQYLREKVRAPDARPYTLYRRTAAALGPGYTTGMIERAKTVAERELARGFGTRVPDPIAADVRKGIINTLKPIFEWLERDLPMESPSRQMH